MKAIRKSLRQGKTQAKNIGFRTRTGFRIGDLVYFSSDRRGQKPKVYRVTDIILREAGRDRG